ncbi:hypothetical protein RJ640_027773 [Escallonia rubra]|uniref:Ubiquitin-like protease family profile domain-containing protein n=1 Tax=Escallonia rubra TaxID=112253 RepID=A0AA88UAN3_9ASTE|nr:hypothetical protein RJ640_027773 [Escallonia rubra]
MADDARVLEYKDIVLRNSDLDILRGPCYLNDQIIGFYFQYLASSFDCDDILLVPPSLSFWLTHTQDLDNQNVAPMDFCSKRVIIFSVNDNEDFGRGDDGSHWSLLVYDRSMNAFVHHDSMEGANNLHAVKLYEAVKPFVGRAAVASAKPKSSSSSARNNKKKKEPAANKSKPSAASTTPPAFIESSSTPQQMNGYDCGLYVIAIARIICQWHTSNSKKKAENWFPALQKHVNASVELTLRDEVMKLIEDLRISG